MALPSGYTQLNYIQSSGNQYINTGFTPTANTRVTMDFQLTTAGTGNRALFAVAGQFSFRWYGSGSVFRSNGNNNADFQTGIDGTARHRVNKTATTCTLDGAYSIKNTAGTVSNPLYLLAQNTGSGVSNYASAKLFACRIYENGSLVRDFVPCTNASGTVGLYDTVNGAFYSNAGSGTFTSGDVYDPTVPVGDHNSLIDGTARAITGGKVMVDGTVRNIKIGKTLINGTVYDISLAPKIVNVTITGTGASGNWYVKVNSTSYYKAATLTLVAPVEIYGYISRGNAVDSILLNNVEMTPRNTSAKSYTFTVTEGDVRIQFSGSANRRILITTS